MVQNINEKILFDELMKDLSLTQTQRCMIYSQCEHESGGFRILQESFAYKPETLLRVFPKKFIDLNDAKLALAKGKESVADRLYLGRMENTRAGDGWKYSGKGFIQLTGKANYREASKGIGVDLIENPQLAAYPEIASKIAIWFFKKNSKLMKYADEENVEEVTLIVNGGRIGLAERIKLYKKNLEKFPHK